MLRKHLYYLLILVIFISAAYSNSLDSPFIFDDISAIETNYPIQIKEFSVDAIKTIFNKSFARSRFVTNLSFALNYMWGGINPFSYHLVNIAIHIGATVFLYLLFLEIFRIVPAYSDYAAELSLFVAGLWSLNPVQTQAVTYVVQRMTSLATMLYIISFYCYLKARKGKVLTGRVVLYILSVLFCLLAVRSKEIAFTLPLILFLYEYFFHAQGDKAKTRRLLSIGIPLGIAALVAVFFYLGQNPMLLIKEHITDEAFYNNILEMDISLPERLMTEARIVFYYISLFLFPAPFRLMLLHYYPVSESMLDPFTTLLSITAFFLLIFMAFRIKKRQILSFFILWYFVNLLLESTLLRLDLVFEHRLYLPSIGLSAIIISVLFDLVVRFGLIKKLGKGVIPAVFCMVMVVLGLLTFNRNEVWKDEVTFFKDNLKKNPKAYRAYMHLGLIYRERGIFNEAIEQFDLAIKVSPDYYQGYLFKAKTLLDTMRPKKALEVLGVASAAAVDSRQKSAVHTYKGLVYTSQGLFEMAVEELNTATRLNPKSTNAYINKGVVYSEMGLFDKALETLDKAVVINPEQSGAYFNKAVIYSKKGLWDKAVEFYDRSIEFNRYDPDAYYYRGIAHSKMKNYQQAINSFKEVLRIEEGNYQAKISLALVYADAGDIDRGIELLKELSGVKKRESDISPFIIMGDFYIVKGEFLLAQDAFKKAMRRDLPEAAYRLGVLNAEKLERPSEAKRYFRLFLQQAKGRGRRPQEVEIAQSYLKKFRAWGAAPNLPGTGVGRE